MISPAEIFIIFITAYNLYVISETSMSILPGNSDTSVVGGLLAFSAEETTYLTLYVVKFIFRLNFLHIRQLSS